MFVTHHPRELVGWGGFKGPSRDGVVEVGFRLDGKAVEDGEVVWRYSLTRRAP